jgi:hypothetical protein
LYPTPVRVSGITVDSSGNPVQGVRIGHLAVRGQVSIESPSAETDAMGRFRFDTIGPAVVFRKDGFESQFARVSGGPTELRIVLKPAPAVEAVPVCRAASKCVSVRTGVLCLPKIKGVRTGDANTTLDTFERTFSVRMGRWQMIHGAGTAWGGPDPRDEDVWSSIAYKERIRDGGGIQVLDASGTTSDGKAWRSVGVAGESVFYFDLDPGAAAKFDQVLDGLCVIRK